MENIFGNDKSKNLNNSQLGKIISDVILGAFANGMKNKEKNIDLEQDDTNLQNNNEDALLPIILLNEENGINKIITVFVNVGNRHSDLAMKYLRNFHLGFTAIMPKLTKNVAFVFIPVRQGDTIIEAIDI